MGAPTQATSKQGELTARALVFRSGGETVAIVSLDLLGFPTVLGDRARALVPRLAPDRILIGVTHTHSAPDTYAYPDGKGGHTGSLEYMNFVTGQIAAAINEALDHLQPAELRVASGEIKGKIAYNYYAPDLYDRRAGVLQARGLDGRPIATLVNYAIHPEVLGSGLGILSPDLAGPFYDRIEKDAGGLAIFMNGAQGGMVTADNRNLDSPPKDALRAYWNDTRAWSECERIGNLLAAESLRLVASAAWQKTPGLNSRSMEVRFPVESDAMWQVVELSPLKYPRGPGRTISARVNLVNLGNAQILTIPGEALPNIGLYLKRQMRGEHNFLFGLTNDAFGYILTKVDFNSFPAYKYISRVSLGEMTGEIYIQHAVELIKQSAAGEITAVPLPQMELERGPNRIHVVGCRLPVVLPQVISVQDHAATNDNIRAGRVAVPVELIPASVEERFGMNVGRQVQTPPETRPFQLQPVAIARLEYSVHESKVSSIPVREQESAGHRQFGVEFQHRRMFSRFPLGTCPRSEREQISCPEHQQLVASGIRVLPQFPACDWKHIEIEVAAGHSV